LVPAVPIVVIPTPVHGGQGNGGITGRGTGCGWGCLPTAAVTIVHPRCWRRRKVIRRVVATAARPSVVVRRGVTAASTATAERRKFGENLQGPLKPLG